MSSVGRVVACLALASCGLAAPARADTALVPQPVITVTASADRSVQNDRMHASLRA
jgi:hypothetical protein